MCNTKIIFPLLLCTLLSKVCSLERRVYNGTDLRPLIHKHLVKLLIEVESEQTDNIVNSLCSGSIIKPYWIISAAHCFKDAIETEVHHLRAGLLSIVKPNSIFLRDNNVEDILSDDLALLKTPNKIKFGKYIQPVQLAATSMKVGTTGIVAGFGESGNKKMEAKEGVVVISPCPSRISNKLICSNDVVRAGSGDSGGPLIAKGRLAGVVSAGCQDVSTPTRCLTFYVDVVEHIDWIVRIIEKSQWQYLTQDCCNVY